MKLKITDIKDMPGFNPAIANGSDSVSTGRVILTVSCATHGAMNKMSPHGIWRCVACNVGAYEVAQ